MTNLVDGGPGGAGVETGLFWADDMNPPLTELVHLKLRRTDTFSIATITDSESATSKTDRISPCAEQVGLKLNEVAAICKAVHDLIEFA